MSKNNYILTADGKLHTVSDEELYHWSWGKKGEERENHKYTKREWKNGRWQYTYPEDKTKTKKPVGKKEETKKNSFFNKAKNAISKAASGISNAVNNIAQKAKDALDSAVEKMSSTKLSDLFKSDNVDKGKSAVDEVFAKAEKTLDSAKKRESYIDKVRDKHQKAIDDNQQKMDANRQERDKVAKEYDTIAAKIEELEAERETLRAYLHGETDKSTGPVSASGGEYLKRLEAQKRFYDVDAELAKHREHKWDLSNSIYRLDSQHREYEIDYEYSLKERDKINRANSTNAGNIRRQAETDYNIAKARKDYEDRLKKLREG